MNRFCKTRRNTDALVRSNHILSQPSACSSSKEPARLARLVCALDHEVAAAAAGADAEGGIFAVGKLVLEIAAARTKVGLYCRSLGERKLHVAAAATQF